MGKKGHWSWSSALIGAASASAVAAMVICRPRDPAFHLASIKLAAFRINLPPALDTDLVLTVHVSNPNVVPIEYGPTAMSIFYEGSLLGSARVDAGSQGSNTCRILRLPARLQGKQLARRASKFAADVARRQMELEAAVDIEGKAKVLGGWWGQRFKVHVDSHIVVDPVFLDVIDQDSKSKMKVFNA